MKPCWYELAALFAVFWLCRPKPDDYYPSWKTVLKSCGLLVVVCVAAFRAFAEPQPIAWIGGLEQAVIQAPAGFETVHFGGQFSTVVDVPDGLYVVTMHFIEPSQHAINLRRFDVYINDQRVLADLDLFARVGFMVPLRRSVIVAVTGGKMVIDFKATIRSAVISAIDVEPLSNLLLN